MTVNIKNAPLRTLTHVIGHDAAGKGGKQAVTGFAQTDSPTFYGNGDSSSVATLRLRPKATGKRTSIDFGDWQVGQDPQTTEDSNAFLYFYNKKIGQTTMRMLNDGQMLRYYYWDGLISTGNSYDKTGTPDNTFFVYGQFNPQATGTGITSRREMVIYNTGVPISGRNEFAADYAVTTVRGDGGIAPGGTYWNGDNHFVSPQSSTTSANSPHFLVGRSLRMINLAIGMDSPNTNQKGSWGYAVGGLPTDAATNLANGNTSTARTFPIVAAFQAYGWSGSPGVADGADAAADYYARAGFRTGGVGGGPYQEWNSSSKFHTAFEANDWTNYGLRINKRLNGAAGFGISNPYETELGGSGITTATGVALIINYNNSGSSRHAAIRFGQDTDQYWEISRDIDGSGGHNLCIYSKESGKNHLLAIGGQGGGGIGFNGSNPIAKPSITGSRGGNAALADLLTKLASYGLILDSTTA